MTAPRGAFLRSNRPKIVSAGAGAKCVGRVPDVVYGLSPAQLRLAGEIIGGLALPAAAGKLGISPNTARTHLNRIFEKTGVSNQAAMVRCPSTVGA